MQGIFRRFPSSSLTQLVFLSAFIVVVVDLVFVQLNTFTVMPTRDSFKTTWPRCYYNALL